LRPGEQIALKPEDIDWEKGVLHVRRAITTDKDGRIIEGNTKNKYSRRAIRLTPAMHEAITAQLAIWEQFNAEYFFCSSEGKPVHLSNLRRRVWLPALDRAGIFAREMRQTRHSFATVALSCNENALWIASVMGHGTPEMVIKIYSKYVENIRGAEDGAFLSDAFRGTFGSAQ
jgi:integrase